MTLENDQDLDDRLRPLFERLRESERAGIPALDTVLSREPRRRRPFVLRRLVLVAGVGLGLVLPAAALWLLPGRAPQRQLTSAEVALLYWRSPTEALLSSQGGCLSKAYEEGLAASGRGKEGRR
jgi:hypothetical protein